jgi:hypothetical protein
MRRRKLANNYDKYAEISYQEISQAQSITWNIQSLWHQCPKQARCTTKQS